MQLIIDRIICKQRTENIYVLYDKKHMVIENNIIIIIEMLMKMILILEQFVIWVLQMNKRAHIIQEVVII